MPNQVVSKTLTRPVTKDIGGRRDGSLWVGFGGPGGVSRIRNEELVNYTSRDGLADGYVSAMAEDRDGTIWVASTGGMCNKEIASLLGIAEPTVHVHVGSIFAKLHVHDRTAALVVALRRGIIRVT